MMKQILSTKQLAIIAVFWLEAGGCNAGQAPDAKDRQTVAVARRDIRSQIQATGLVRAVVGAEVKVGARISGKVERLFANVGDQVKRGDPIAKLEDADLKARLARAEAELAAAKAQLALLHRGARGEEIAEAEAQVQQSRGETALATADATRQAMMIAHHSTSQEEVDRATRNLAVAKGKLTASLSRLQLLRRRYLPEDIALGEAKVKLAEASVAEAQATLNYATLTAPISGVVAMVSTQEGETVAAGMNSPTFVTIIDLAKLEVAAYVDEVDIGRVAVGQSASFTVDSFADIDFTGKITSIYPRAVIQSNVVNYITTVSIDNSEGRLKPDMTATVTIVLAERRGVLSVPEKALRSERGQRVVYVIQGGATVARSVKAGQRSAGYIEITQGLKEGDIVLVAGEVDTSGAANSPAAAKSNGGVP